MKPDVKPVQKPVAKPVVKKTEVKKVVIDAVRSSQSGEVKQVK